MRNKTVILTHAKNSLEGLGNSLEKRGINALHFPVISINKNEFELPRTDYDWIVFTSRYGVQFFFENISTEEINLLRSNKTKFACIGSYTADKLLQYSFISDLTSKIATGKELSKLLTIAISKNDKVLLALGTLASKILSETLDYVEDIERIDVYNNKPAQIDKKLKKIISSENFDRITFSSPSAVIYLKDNIGDGFLNINSKSVAIGGVTAQALKENNINNILIAENGRHSLLDTIINSFKDL